MIDGQLDDPCWKAVEPIGGFTSPESSDPPEKSVAARVCFGGDALYLAIVCTEPEPDKLRIKQAEGEQVWLDDCVELWIRTTDDSAEFDQFIVNPAGRRESVRRRREPKPWNHQWSAAAKVGPAEWQVEIAIPFRTLSAFRPAPGVMLQMKIGREDHTQAKPALAVWPPGAPYAGTDGYEPVYFETENLLKDPALAAREDWEFPKGDEARFVRVAEGNGSFVRFSSPGRDCAISQRLVLRPGTPYRAEVDVAGTAGIRLSVSTENLDGRADRLALELRPSRERVHHELRFVAGSAGQTTLSVGGSQQGGRGQAEISGLRLLQEPMGPDRGEAVPLAADSHEPTVLSKILVSDCRAVRGFLGAAVDGSTASRGWDGRAWEYNQSGAGAGVGYHYRANDGLHITLADRQGFNAMVVRGGARAQVWRDCPSYESADGGTLIASLPGRCSSSRLFSRDPIVTDRVDFFDVGDGRIADVSFFRLRPAETLGRLTGAWSVSQELAGDLPEISDRFPAGDRAAYGVERATAGRGSAVKAARDRAVHILSAAFAEETCLSAVGMDAVVRTAVYPVTFTASVQDPVNPRSELYGADFALSGPGRMRLVLDFPDQMIPAGRRLWLTLRFDCDATVSGPDGGGPVIELYGTSRDEAVKEALPYRKLLVKSYFAALSEPRPWNAWYTDDDVAKTLSGELGSQCSELREAILHCMTLSPDDPVIRQYYEWIWRQHREWRAERNRGILPAPEKALIAPVDGAPEWAVVAHQAWLEARRVPQWWLDNRLAPTGEFGGQVGDDTDMYQNYADFAMLESDGVAATLKSAAARLAELAERTCLTSGINSQTMDPLHAYEEGINHEALMAWWFYGDPVYLERCMTAAMSTAEALTTVTLSGHRHFKSQSLGAADLRGDRGVDIDGHAHPLMWHPALEVVWYNRNPAAETYLREWADGWLDHMAPGQYATAVDVGTERVLETSETPLSGGYGAQGSVFEFLYWITGETKYIRPFIEQMESGRNIAPDGIVPEMIHRHGLAELGGRLRDLARRGPAATLVTGDKAPLIEALKTDIAELQSYFHMYTSAEPFTDRVFLSAATNAAIAYTGGYATRNKLCHSHAVSYEGLGTDYAALVLLARPDRLKVLLFNFAREESRGRLRFWTLDHGRYRLSLGIDADGDDKADTALRGETVEIARGEPLRLDLPPGKTVVLELVLEERLDDLRERADMALSPLDLSIEEGAVVGFVHNIGSRPAEGVELALLDAAGKVVSSATIEKLDAPLDLIPKRERFKLAGLKGDTRGWSVSVDPELRIPEIYEGNNRVPVPAPAGGGD